MYIWIIGAPILEFPPICWSQWRHPLPQMFVQCDGTRVGVGRGIGFDPGTTVGVRIGIGVGVRIDPGAGVGVGEDIDVGTGVGVTVLPGLQLRLLIQFISSSFQELFLSTIIDTISTATEAFTFHSKSSPLAIEWQDPPNPIVPKRS